MTTAYIMIKTAPGKEREVFKHLDKNLKTKQKDLVFGPYDIVLRVRTTDTTALQRLVIERIRDSPDVTGTVTLTCHGLAEEKGKATQEGKEKTEKEQGEKPAEKTT